MLHFPVTMVAVRGWVVPRCCAAFGFDRWCRTSAVAATAGPPPPPTHTAAAACHCATTVCSTNTIPLRSRIASASAASEHDATLHTTAWMRAPPPPAACAPPLHRHTTLPTAYYTRVTSPFLPFSTIPYRSRLRHRACLSPNARLQTITLLAYARIRRLRRSPRYKRACLVKTPAWCLHAVTASAAFFLLPRRLRRNYNAAAMPTPPYRRLRSFAILPSCYTLPPLLSTARTCLYTCAPRFRAAYASAVHHSATPRHCSRYTARRNKITYRCHIRAQHRHCPRFWLVRQVLGRWVFFANACAYSNIL